MTSNMVSRWPVLVSSTIAVGEADAAGRLTPQAIERLFAEGRVAYFEQCSTVDGDALPATITSIQQSGSAASGTDVSVVVGVVEIFPAGFTMAARIRSGGADAIGIDATCSVTVDAVTSAMRDEFIALAHRAAYAS